MTRPRGKSASFLTVCTRCDRPLTVRREWAGREVQCPHCASVLRVPPAPADERAVPAQAPGLRARFRFNFGCPRCRTLLEAHTGMCGQTASCPTCAARLVVPDVDPRTGLPREVALLDTNDQNPTPLHAYAASGDQAPQIHRLPDGQLVIECPRCQTRCPVDADSCPACAAPFTIDAAPTASSHATESWAATALVLGIVSLPLFFLLVPGGLAVLFGVLSLRSSGLHSPSRFALAGLILGIISLLAGALMWAI